MQYLSLYCIIMYIAIYLVYGHLSCIRYRIPRLDGSTLLTPSEYRVSRSSPRRPNKQSQTPPSSRAITFLTSLSALLIVEACLRLSNLLYRLMS